MDKQLQRILFKSYNQNKLKMDGQNAEDNTSLKVLIHCSNLGSGPGLRFLIYRLRGNMGPMGKGFTKHEVILYILNSQ